MSWQAEYKKRLVTPENAVSVIKSGDQVMLAGACSAPPDLVAALCARYQELENVTIWAGLLMYPFDFLKREYRGHLNYVTIFFGPVERMFYAEGNIENFAFHFSRADRATLETAKCNVVMCEVSPPDERWVHVLWTSGHLSHRRLPPGRRDGHGPGQQSDAIHIWRQQCHPCQPG